MTSTWWHRFRRAKLVAEMALDTIAEGHGTDAIMESLAQELIALLRTDLAAVAKVTDFRSSSDLPQKSRYCLKCNRLLAPNSPTAACYDGCDHPYESPDGLNVDISAVPCFKCGRPFGDGERCPSCGWRGTVR